MSTRSSLRRRLERVGIGLTAILAVAMVGLLAIDALRSYPVVDVIYEQARIAGWWLDHYLGTNVFYHPFMWRSIATGILIGVVAPLVGTYLVHREMALIGETLAHTAFAGVAVGLVVSSMTGWSGSLMLVALVVGILGALGVQWLAERTDTYGDVPIAIMLTGSFAVGTLIISYGRGMTGFNVEGYLFGNISVVTPSGARLMAVISVVVVLVTVATYKQLLFITFDEQAARVARLNVTWYNTLLIVMTAVVVVGAMQILGVILVAAMLVVPVATATQVAHSFRETLTLSILVGQIAVVGGFALSISQGLPTGGSIVVVAIACYLLAIFASSRSTAAISTH
ncbi:ABC-3 protein [Natrinema pellirubrum DSM 15624]|uniref:ABC-3 protein n=1 Tax=Natrinema pellirubrum (strain DSM 15624 / CIP 106293 / JCM 10476 / NCIMB 786 / 157) TaxID=797303 RepID=L0JL48_NATP1|nr:metal ABC transporter permease [Natrinema pellirubrum]AGB32255.1 ABC-type Mn2+/Zn2+ transport system, permease component [Natrinema pellirubrum DSM 15624]ELY74688.1 ABC-3 protein [Natrinema pellirubrum DSM 15624]